MHSPTGSFLIALAAVTAAAAAGPALADGPRGRVGVSVAAPGVAVHYQSRGYRPAPRVYATPRLRYGPSVYLAPVPIWGAPAYYYGAPYWYGGVYGGANYYGPGYPYGQAYPGGAPAGPQVYIERGADEGAPAPSAAAPAQGWWYWCGDPEGYYPTVRECPGGWQQVAPQPPSRP